MSEADLELYCSQTFVTKSDLVTFFSLSFGFVYCCSLSIGLGLLLFPCLFPCEQEEKIMVRLGIDCTIPHKIIILYFLK